jgi:hypothetical protein
MMVLELDDVGAALPPFNHSIYNRVYMVVEGGIV